MSSIIKNLKYSKTHEWVRVLENGNVQVGITDHAQAQMGDIVFFNLSCEGATVSAGALLGDFESIKAVSDVYSPIGGVVVKVNQEVLDNPSLVNTEPYEAWLVEITKPTGIDKLVPADEYEKIVAAEG